MEPGARLRLGREVLIEITSYTPPCEAIIPFFKDGNFKRMSNRRFPGWARVYAKVLQTGTIRVGDRVCVE
jgi:MOSC domain-containing protein YiiM